MQSIVTIDNKGFTESVTIRRRMTNLKFVETHFSFYFPDFFWELQKTKKSNKMKCKFIYNGTSKVFKQNESVWSFLFQF